MIVVGNKVMDGKRVIREFASNEEAWRWLDKQEGQHLSPKERTSDWAAKQFLQSEFANRR